MNESIGSMNDIGSKAVESLTAILGDPTPGTIYADPVAVGEDLVFTAVAWERGGGFGFGGGGDNQQGRGFGSGGGGGAQGRPVAVIRVGPKGIEVQPVIDFTKVGITLLLTGLGVWKALRR
ncbi:MAG: hypothetical protein ACRDWH_06595 [Acidimicrobiia bacterium]